MIRTLGAAVIAAAIAATAFGQERVDVQLPQPRPAEADAVDVPLPEPRPEHEPASQEAAATETEDDAPEGDAVPDGIATRERVYQTACPAVLSGEVVADIAPPESDGQCGIRSPLAIEALDVGSGPVEVTGGAEINCPMATALRDWAQEVSAYAEAVLGSPLAGLTSGPGYTCRLRNNAETGFVSEHGFGNAMDVLAFTLEDGRTFSVLDTWADAPESLEEDFMAFAHSAACGKFTTVLGPEANAAHANHFHLDLGCHGRTCTAQICE